MPFSLSLVSGVSIRISVLTASPPGSPRPRLAKYRHQLQVELHDFQADESIHVLEDMMSEAGEDGCFDLHGFKVEGELEKDPQALFNALLDRLSPEFIS